MVNFSVTLLLFFTLLLGHGIVELEASAHHQHQSGSSDQPYRTGYHFQPIKNWMNDPNGPMIYKGIYHLFYQYNPYGAVWGNIVWAHSTSTDLVNWTPHEIALDTSDPSDSHGCWSGSATILPGGKPAIIYTGTIDLQGSQVQNLAMPKNFSDPYLKEWFKYKKNPILSAPEPINATLFRDPTTAWLGPDKIWRMVIGSLIDNKKGLLILYKSKDFKHWIKAKDPLYSETRTGMLECPDFFPVSTADQNGVETSILGPDVKHVFKVSLFDDHIDSYSIGTYDVGKDKFIPEEGYLGDVPGLRFDYGKFYASKSFFDSDKNRRILWGWVNESSTWGDDIKKGWSGLQAIPRSFWLDKSGKQLVQWPVPEIESLRENQVDLPSKFLKGGSLLEISGVTAAQYIFHTFFRAGSLLNTGVKDIEISFEVTEFEKAEVLEPNWTNPQLLCNQKGASVKSALGPFGLLVLASEGLQEYTAVFFRIFKGQDKYVVLMCSDQSRSSLNNKNDKTSYGAFLKVDPVHEKLSLRSLIDHSIVESFGGGGKACITARVYPTLAIENDAHLYAFNYGTEKVKTTSLSSWSMKKARINVENPIERVVSNEHVKF